MDLEDNETAMNSVESQVEELKGTKASLEAQISDMEAMLQESKAQVGLLILIKQLFSSGHHKSSSKRMRFIME